MNELIQKLSHACQTGSSREKLVFHTALYDTLFTKVYLIAYRFSKNEADDLTSNIFLKYFETDIHFLYKHSEYLDKYLLKSARHYCISYTKRNNKNRCYSIIENLDQIENDSNSIIFNLEIQYDLDQALLKLASKELKVVRLKLEGHNYKEIAVLLNVTENAVKKRIQRAKMKIKSHFEAPHSSS